MAEHISAASRSRIMRAIKSKNTKPELLVRKYLFSRGYRYRLHCINLPGRPDIVLPKFKKIILVNGCFWHQHQKKSCKISSVPTSNRAYWIPKLQRNRLRDQNNINILRNLGWRVLVVWECDLRKSATMALSRINKFLGEN
jgi:DNA mismatch endonuclease (patch repair protein)